MARGRGFLAAADLSRLQQRTYIEASIALVFVLVLVSDIYFGPNWCWYFTFLIPIFVRLIRSRYKAPGWAAVHVYGVDE